MCWQTAKLFELSSLSKTTLSYIESRFATISETQNFLELDIRRVLEILRSSQLFITSELEVCGAAERWMSGNDSERSKHAEDLLSPLFAV